MDNLGIDDKRAILRGFRSSEEKHYYLNKMCGLVTDSFINELRGWEKKEQNKSDLLQLMEKHGITIKEMGETWDGS